MNFWFRDFNILVNNQLNAEFYLVYEEIKNEKEYETYDPLINIGIFEAIKDFKEYYSTKSNYIYSKNNLSLTLDNCK